MGRVFRGRFCGDPLELFPELIGRSGQLEIFKQQFSEERFQALLQGESHYLCG